MNTNLEFVASGVVDGMGVVSRGFLDALEDFTGTTFMNDLVSSMALLVTIVLVWYGIRAILRAIMVSK